MNNTRVMGYMLVLLALAVAGCAAFFSITGLAKLFAAALLPVIIMAGVLEVGKLGATFYLHRYWDELPKMSIKIPLSIMVGILMLITSMGIFGFLSKGYTEQENPAIEYQLEITNLDEKIKAREDAIASLKIELDQVNSALDAYVKNDKVTAALRSKDKYQPDIDRINKAISSERAGIAALREEKMEWKKKLNEVEAELGPIKYTAELFGFDVHSADGKGKAVRLVIVLLMLAFDPLAIVLIIAADWTFLKHEFEEKEKNRKIFELEESERKKKEEEKKKKEELLEARRREKEEEQRLEREEKRRQREEEHKKKLEEIEAKKSNITSEEKKKLLEENEKLISKVSEIKSEKENLLTQIAETNSLLSNEKAQRLDLEEKLNDEMKRSKSSYADALIIQQTLDQITAESLVLNEEKAKLENRIKVLESEKVKDTNLEQELLDKLASLEEDRQKLESEKKKFEQDVDNLNKRFSKLEELENKILISEQDKKEQLRQQFLEESEKRAERLREYLKRRKEDESERMKEARQRAEEQRLHSYPEDIKNILKTSPIDKKLNPLESLQQAFLNDISLIEYLLAHPDVYDELKKIGIETDDDKVRTGIRTLVDKVEEERKKRETKDKGWLS